MLCNTGYESAVYSGRSVDMLRRSRAKACFKGDGNACCGCSRFLAAFGFTGVKVVCGVLCFQSGGNGNGYFTVFVCSGCFRIRIITVQIERVLPGRVVHFCSFRLQTQLSALCISIGKILQVWGAEITVSHQEYTYFISCIQGRAFNDAPADGSSLRCIPMPSAALPQPSPRHREGELWMSVSHPANNRNARPNRYDMFFLFTHYTFSVFMRVLSAFTLWVRLRSHRPVSR